MLQKGKNIDDGKKYLKLLMVGLIVSSARIFAYVVVRGRGGISTVGVTGRDSLLLAFGAAICIYCAIRLFLKCWLQQIALLIVLVLGCLSCCREYSNYQEEWYESLKFENACASIENIREDDTFWVVNKYEMSCDTMNFYSLNANAYEIFGNQTRCFGSIDFLANCLGNVSVQESLNGYMMDEYSFIDSNIDGVLILDNKPLSVQQIFRLKKEEMLDYDMFLMI